MLVKASAVTNLTDARYFAAKEADFLGFNLEEGTEGYLDPMFMRAIREWVAGPKIVGEFSRAPLPTVREAAAFFGLDAVQVRAEQGDLRALAGLEVVLEMPIAAGFSMENLMQTMREAAPQVRYFLLDFAQNGLAWASLAGEMALLKKCCAEFPVLLAADFSAENLPHVLAEIAPAGIAVRGGAEERVGVKSFDELDEVFEALGTGF